VQERVVREIRMLRAMWRELETGHMATAPTLDPTCVQQRLVCSVGVSPTGARVRSPVAWIASVEETKLMKPIDKAILGMVSESPGRNASEPRSGLEKKCEPEAEPTPSG
jgi:hypothetical protein